MACMQRGGGYGPAHFLSSNALTIGWNRGTIGQHFVENVTRGRFHCAGLCPDGARPGSLAVAPSIARVALLQPRVAPIVIAADFPIAGLVFGEEFNALQ